MAEDRVVRLATAVVENIETRFEFIDENGDFDEEGMAECKKPKRRALFETAVGLGPVGLMLGWKERLAHTTLIVVIQLTVYDNIKRALFSS